MIKVFLFLLFTTSLQASIICKLVQFEYQGEPRFTFLPPKELTEFGRNLIHDDLARLKVFTQEAQKYLIVPKSVETTVELEGDFLDAHCFVCSDQIVVHVDLLTKNQEVRDGILGHELGHLLFNRTLEMGIEKAFDAPLKSTTAIVEKWFEGLTDVGQIREEIKTLERDYPDISSYSAAAPPVDIPHSDFTEYLFLKDLLATVDNGVKLDALDKKALFFHSLAKEMGGFQEVFSDLTAAVYGRDASIMAKALVNPLSKKLRDFSSTETITEADQKNILQYAREDIPHLLLFALRRKIFDQYYRSIGHTIGENRDYDFKVMQMVLDKTVLVFMRVSLDPDPKTKKATAFLRYKKIVEGILYELHTSAIHHEWVAVGRVKEEEEEQLKYNIVKLNIPDIEEEEVKKYKQHKKAPAKEIVYEQQANQARRHGSSGHY